MAQRQREDGEALNSALQGDEKSAVVVGGYLAAGPPVRRLLPQLVLGAWALCGWKGQVPVHLRLRRGLLRRGLQRAKLSPWRCVVVLRAAHRPKLRRWAAGARGL